MVAWPGQAGLALLVGLLPIGEIREVGPDFANRIFDDGPAVDNREIREGLTKVPIRQGVRMLFGRYRLEFSAACFCIS